MKTGGCPRSLRRLAAGLAFCALAGCQTGSLSSEQSCEIAFVTALRLDRGDDQFFTTIGVNGHRARMLLDTGSVENVLTADAAGRLGLRPDLGAEGAIIGIGGEEVTTAWLANDVQVGRMHGKRLRFAAVRSLASFRGVQPDGILGMNFLADFDMDIDFTGRQITLFRASGHCERPAVTLSGDLYTAPLINSRFQFSPTINVVVGGATLRAVIDTGAQKSAIFSDAADLMGIARQVGPRAATHEQRGFGSTAVASFSYVLPEMEAGGATIHNVGFEVLDHPSSDQTALLLGADFLQQVHVWVSRSSNTLVLQIPPRPSPPLPAAGAAEAASHPPS